MKNLYHWYLKTVCLLGISLAGNTAALTVVTAQTTSTSNQGYVPLNVGKIIPNGNSMYQDERQKTTFIFDASNNENRLPQPVVLSEYSVIPGNGGVELRWRTTWEPDNLKLYQIEYSKDGFTFQQAGVVPAQNYLNGRAYSFRHVAVNGRDRIFYRIRMVDKTGHYDYTTTIPVQANGTTENYVFPTIVNAGNVSLYLNSDSFKMVQIVNMQGRILQTEMINGRTGRIDITLSKSATGICIVRVIGDNPQQSIVQKVFINS